jgi:hypothetical protein
MPTEDYSNKTRISRIRENVLYLGKTKVGKPVSISEYSSRALGDVPIKVKNSSGMNLVNRSSNTGGPPTLVSLTYAGSNYITCSNDPTRQSMTMTITARFNRPIISVSAPSGATTVFNFTVSGNTATIAIPSTRCADPNDSSIPIVFTVDGIYTVNGTLFIPANT